MANENKASYTRIGFTVVIAVTAIFGTLIYLGGLRGRGAEVMIETYYTKGVSGLSVGSPVNMRGVKIGEVREISFIGVKYPAVNDVDSARIYISMALSHKMLGITEDDELNDELVARTTLQKLVEKGFRATVTSSGITGVSRIELDFYSPEKVDKIEPISWQPKYFFVPPQVGLLDSFSDSATKVMNQINKMDLSVAWSNISSSVESMARATESARIMMETRQSDLDKAIEDFSDTMRSFKDFSSDIKRNPALLIRERKRSALPETAR